MKRVIAATLAVLMLVTAVPMDAMAAQADETDNAVVEEVTETEETTEKEDTAAQEVTEDETVSAEENDNVEEATEIVTPQTDIDIEFLYVDVPEIQGGEAERILLGVTDTSVVSSIVLRVRNLTTGNVFAYTHTDKTDKSFLFEFVPQESGEYLVEGVSYVVNDVSTDYSFADNGMECKFGVDVQVTTQPDAIVEDAEDVAAEVVVTDQNGTTISDKSISEVLEETSVQVQKNRAAASKDVVVVLDPGHGGSDGGAQGNGLSEKNLNLAIAQYCKTELETYSGVKVYMTRTDDTFVGLEDRVALARNWGATIFVSIHVNSSTNASANGAEVWHPNPTGDPNIHASGAALAQNIENQLVTLGLANRGIHYRNYSYDWSVDENLGDADYYSVIRNAKASGIPGVIVEHAFISNGSDAANYLGNSAALQKLGIADATGIAQYFGLTKESYVKMKSAAAIDATGIKLTWNKYPNADGYYVYRESATETKSYIGRTTSLSYIDRTGTYGTKYKYTIQAYQNQDSQRVRISKLTDDGLEAKVGDFIVAIQAVSNDIFNTNKISWTKASGVVGYYVFRKEPSDAKWTKIGATSETSFIDEKAQCGKQYLYTVRAYWKNGDTTVYSNYNRQGIAIKTATGKIVNIKTVKCSFNMNKIVWSSMEGATGYKVLRKDGQNKWTTIGTTTGTSFVDYTGQCGKTYSYTVRAYRKSGDSIYYGQYDSTGASITTNTGMTTGIKATASTYNYNKITWTSLKGATGYRVYRKTQGQSWTNMGSVTTTQFVDRTAQCGVKYYYTVRAYRTRDGVTYWGQYDKTGAQVTTNNPKVNGITAARTTFNGIKLTWNEVKGATKYIILKKNDNGSWTNIGNTTELYYVDTTPQCGIQYTYTVRACRIYGGKSYYGAINNPGVTIQSNHCTATLQSLERTAAGVDLSWKKVGGATAYMVYRKVSGGKLQKLATVSGLSYTDTTVDSGVYYYTVRAYRKTSDGIYYGKYNASGTPIDTEYAIMGQSNVSVQQMINYFNSSGKQFPAWVYARKGASNIAEFCQLVYNIAVSEGVKAEVVFAQICKERGFLQFGGDVSAEQCNFAGMGATGNGEPGCWFADVAAGILGQVRHLKLYASTDINQVPNDGADPRYSEGLLGKAPYVEWLSIPHNPDGKGWAAAESYGRDLISMIWKMRSM